jgi:hypothetical protein
VGGDHKMALGALFAAIRWVLARFLARRSRHRGGVQFVRRTKPGSNTGAAGQACVSR